MQEKCFNIDLSKYTDDCEDEFVYTPFQGLQLKLLRWLCDEEGLTVDELKHVSTDLCGDNVHMELFDMEAEVTYEMNYNSALSTCTLKITG